MSVSRNLQRSLGGTWTYDRLATWWCDDGKRHVSRVSAGVDECDNPVGPPQMWLYGGNIPERAEQFCKHPAVSLLLRRRGSP